MMKRLFFLAATVLFGLTIVTPSESAQHAAAPQKPVKINIMGTATSGVGYILSFAMADILGKHHPWLQAAAVETKGTGENTLTLALQPEKRQDTIICSSDVVLYAAKIADKPFKAAYTGARAIAKINSTASFYVTLDPRIKTMKDFAGKRINTMFKLSGPDVETRQRLETLGILDKVKIENRGWEDGAALLKDGLVDVLFSTAGGPPLWNITPHHAELLRTADLYFIPLGFDMLRAMHKKTGYPVEFLNVPAKTFGSRQTQALESSLYTLAWYADEAMPENLVYEFTKAIYDNLQRLPEYTYEGKGITKENMASVPHPESLFHKGAIRFYKEKGIKIGSESLRN